MAQDRVHVERPLGPLERAMHEAELQESVLAIQRLTQALSDAYDERDDLIRTVYRRIPTRSLIKLTGLSRDRLYTIAGRPMVADRDDSGV